MRVPVEAALNVGVDPLVLVAGRAKVYHLKPEMTELLFFSGLWSCVQLCSQMATQNPRSLPGKQTRTRYTRVEEKLNFHVHARMLKELAAMNKVLKNISVSTKI
jgi:hypothetical protein